MWSLEQAPKRIIRLLDEQRDELGSLRRPSVWSNNAEIVTPAGRCWVKGRSTWSSTLLATMEDVPVWEIRSGWKNMLLFRPGAKDPTYTVTRTSVWQYRHRVADMAGRMVLVVSVHFSWRQFERIYTLEEVDTSLCKPVEVLLMVHAIHVRFQRSSAAAAAG